MPDINSTTPTATSDQQTPFNEAYQRHLPEFEALKLEELVAVNLDIATVVTTVLGALPEILGYAADISEELPKFDLARVRDLESYAMALSHANTLYLLATQPPDALQPLVDDGTKLRERLLADANALIPRGMINGNRLKDLKGPIGYKNLAVDLQILTTLFRESFAQVEGKCATTVAELNQGEQLAAGILRAVGLKEQGTALVAATSDIRTRALTLLLHIYDSARRVIAFLRWHENDADTIAPSLYAGRGGVKKKTVSDVPEPPKAPPQQPGAAVEAVTTAPAPGTGAARDPQGAVEKPTGKRVDPFLS